MPKQRTPRLRAKINRRRVSSNQRKKAEAPLLPGKVETAVSTPEKRGFESPFTSCGKGGKHDFRRVVWDLSGLGQRQSLLAQVGR